MGSKSKTYFPYCYALAVMGAALLFYPAEYQGDDIHLIFQYVQNFLDTGRWFYSSIYSGNSATSILHPILTVIFASISNVHVGIELVFTVPLALIAFLVSKLALQKTGSFLMATTVPPLLILSPFLVETIGRETSLYSFLAIAMVYSFERKRYLLSGTYLGLLMLTRLDAAVFALPLVVAYHRREKSFPIWPFVISLGIVGSGLALQWGYTGEILSRTLQIKKNFYASGFFKKDYFLSFGWHVFEYFIKPVVTLPFLLLCGLLGRFYIKNREELRVDSEDFILISGFFLVLLGYTVLRVPGSGYYYYPYLVVPTYLLAKHADRILRPKWAIPTLLVATLLGNLIFFVTMPVQEARARVPYLQLATWLKENTSKEESISIDEPGMVGFYSERPVVDMLGLVNDLEVSEALVRHDHEFILRKYKPTRIAFHDENTFHHKFEDPIRKSPLFAQNYSPEFTIKRSLWGSLHIYKRKEK